MERQRDIYCVFVGTVELFDSVYIGRTKNIRRRMMQHGHPPFWSILETVIGFDKAHERETFWKQYFASLGVEMLNRYEPRPCPDRCTRPLRQLAYFKAAIAKHGDSDECLIWPFSFAGAGYGVVPVGDGKVVYVHRRAWEVAHPGESIPDGLEIMHAERCISRRCFNQRHLTPGTRKQNMETAKKLGRTKGPGQKTAGEKNGRAILTEPEVILIRELHASGKMGHRKIAKKVGVSRNLVQLIVQGKLWKHLLPKEAA